METKSPTDIPTLGQFNPISAYSIFPVFVGESKDVRLRNILDFGTGFLFEYDDHIFFVTADHVVHKDDFDNGIRSPKDFTPWIYSSQHDERLWPKMIPVPHCTSLSSANLHDICTKYPHRLADAIENIATPSETVFEDEELAEVAVPNMHDISYSFLIDGVKDEIFSIFFPHTPYVKIPMRMQQILVLKESQIGCINENGTYHTAGFIDNYISSKDSLFHTSVRFISGLTFMSREAKDDTHPDEIVWLNSPDIFLKDELKGMSGAPLFDEHDRLCGIVIRTYHVNHSVAVYPIEELIRLLKIEIRISSLPPCPSSAEAATHN
ncbi:MAG: hypothetical protein K2H96_01365 [Muribaculaceae bacterium]|nr:hypothetical protein [Muribaculaceae bacterium]